MASTSITEVFLSLGGRAVSLTGDTLVSLGGLYGVNKISSSGIKVVQALPNLIGGKEQEKENDTVLTKKNIRESAKSYGYILLAILSGTLLGVMGRHISNEETIKSVTKLLYK